MLVCCTLIWCGPHHAGELLPWLIDQFLRGEARLAAVFGDAGAGKSLLTAHLQGELTRRRAELGVLPLRVELKGLRQRDLALGLGHALQQSLGLSESELQLLRESPALLLLLLDGYHQLRRDHGQRPGHADQLLRLRLLESRGAWPRARVLLTCRSRMLPTAESRARALGVQAAQR